MKPAGGGRAPRALPQEVRIIGGQWKRTPLRIPAGIEGLRPTPARVRETLFDWLGATVAGARCFDAFAGTGALGLEALSRGAEHADFVEFRPASLHALRANVAALRLRDRVRIFKRDALPFVAALDPERYDIAFADPPYESRMLDRVIDSWRTTRFARILAVEHASTHDLPRGANRRAFEDTVVTIYRL